MSRRYITSVVAALSVVVLTCVGFVVPVPYVTMRPGPVFDTLGDFDGDPMFTFGDDVKLYDTSGTLDFTTVSVSRANTDVSLAEAIRAYFTSNVAVVPRSSVYPDHTTQKESTQQSAAQLSSSKDNSTAAALRAAGYEVTEVPTIAAVLDDGAAAGLLEPGDVVTRVDGDAVDSAKQLVKAISAHEPGDTVVLDVTRDGDEKTVSITTRAAEDDPDLPRVGVTVSTGFTFPIEVDNNVGQQIGGPSAGTMFALAIYDKLTPGALTGGRRIAGTGAIDADGVVEPIGGIRQKMAGASKDRAEIFLVPAANCDEAADGDDFGMSLVKITTLADAIDSLEALADDPEATVPRCP